MLKALHFAFILLIVSSVAFAAETSVIGFYNVENMFDHIDDPNTNDTEYTPNAGWTQKKSAEKIANIATVITTMGTPDVMGLAEVENAAVLDILISSPSLTNCSYVHYDSPDERGIDVALIYKKTTFVVLNSRAVPVDLTPMTTRPTRDILHVEGNLKGERIHLLVNHWPSRSSGQALTAAYRAAAAKTAKLITDEISSKDATAKIILMGDLNDNPNDRSLVTHLGSKNIKSNLLANDLYNPFYLKFKKGYGSNVYQDTWFSFDQILVSNNLVKAQTGWKFTRDEVFNRSFLIQQNGRYKGHPLRTNNETGSVGYSDHLPVMIFLEK